MFTFERSSRRLDQLSELEGSVVIGDGQVLLEDIGLLSERAVVEEVDRILVLEGRHLVTVDEIITGQLGHLDERWLLELVFELIGLIFELEASTERLARVGTAHDQVLTIVQAHWNGHSHVVLARLTTARIVLAFQLAKRASRPVYTLLAVFFELIQRDVEQELTAADQHVPGVQIVM